MRSLFIALFLVAGLSFAKEGDKERVIVVSWGDIIGNSKYPGAAQLDTPDRVRLAAKAWKEHGVDKVLFRVDDWRYLLFHHLYMPDGGPYESYLKTMRKAWETGVMEAAFKASRDAGIEVHMWISIIDEGADRAVFYDDVEEFPWQAKFVAAHPEMQSCDRSLTESGRKYHAGVLEFAYPEVRAFVLEQIVAFADKLPIDGIFLSFRSHSPPPEHADQFGFNRPVVEEYQKRYGKNILRQNFDLEKWRSLRGEYLTQFLREVRAYADKRKVKVSLGVPQGEHAGPPVGNIELQWRTWVKEKLIDDLIVGHHTLQRATYTNRYQRGWGYVQDQDEKIGLPPIEVSLERDYGPACREAGVKLYVDLPLGNFHRIYRDPTLGKGEERPEDLAVIMAKMQKIPTLDGIVVDGRPFAVAAPQ
jgi:hypothetical protein